MLKQLAKEILIAAILGGAPLLIGYKIGGAKQLEETIKALLPSSTALYYSVFLMAPYFILAFLEWWLLKTTDTAKQVWRFIVSTFSEVGGGFLGVLRVATGVLLGFPLLWLAYDEASFDPAHAGVLCLYGMVALVECAFISKAHEWLKVREPKGI